ncbi:hypothetical protein CDN99_03575 [Roseateles aquatilis]|uniref:Uncharacterized protein n=1 Tax=Roseateles aquatilis TaxID=431061 RepID=A0A246JLM8_9BURK|nr:hypothetical protein [Roseateles aquatilis]OWQ93554.1 hypothetical protein CDN99_03575 [Roseateles aquatilis]
MFPQSNQWLTASQYLQQSVQNGVQDVEDQRSVQQLQNLKRQTANEQRNKNVEIAQGVKL